MPKITLVGGLMDGGLAARKTIDELLPQRLERLRTATGLPVVFGGATHEGLDDEQLRLDYFLGTVSNSMSGLVVQPGKGLGGSVLRHRTPLRVNDYATTVAITHEYDRAVLTERLTSVFAIPVLVWGQVQGVVYGAVRDRRPIGDRTVQTAIATANQLRRDVEDKLGASPLESPSGARSAVAELAAVIRDTNDPEMRERLIRIRQDLIASAARSGRSKPALTPRETEALRLVEVGASNPEIATQLGLSLETVKAYLRSAMRRLEVHTRAAAAQQARVHGLL
jgi:LuxR family transcriptional regulator, regulator of acetate metabolism